MAHRKASSWVFSTLLRYAHTQASRPLHRVQGARVPKAFG